MQGLETTPTPVPEARIAALETALAAERALVAKVTAERDLLRASHERLRLELELLRRRLLYPLGLPRRDALVPCG